MSYGMLGSVPEDHGRGGNACEITIAKAKKSRAKQSPGITEQFSPASPVHSLRAMPIA
jgi:hypothetical protein